MNEVTRVERDAKGHFVVGCRGGPGNPHVKTVNRLRAALLRSVTEGDVKAAIRVLRDVMKTGRPSDRVAAARELLDRTIGKAHETVEAALLNERPGVSTTTSSIPWRMISPGELAALDELRRKLVARATCPACEAAGAPCPEHGGEAPQNIEPAPQNGENVLDVCASKV
jgi:hypothetical protein